QDRSGRQFVLPMSHEETFAFHGKELQSYKQLPQAWYHFGTKERDEPRPRGGLLRVREFIMKDSYSFDRDEAGLDESFRKHAEAYGRIFERCELEYYEVEAESGEMGGKDSNDFLAPGAGQNYLVRCENGDYAADIDAAHGVPAPWTFPDPLDAPEEVETPGMRTIEDVSKFLQVDARATAKAMPVVVDGKIVLALIRGDDRLDEAKLAAVLGQFVRPAHPEEITEAFGASGGSIGPVASPVPVLADEALREGQYVVGANSDDRHLKGVQAGRDYEAATALDAAGLSILLDDRDARAGEKFADADLIGLPYRITVGKKTLEDGAVDLRDRATGDERRVPIGSLGEAF